LKKIFSLLGCVIAIGGYRAFPALAHTEAGGVKSLEKRIEQLEDAVTRTVENQRWYERIRISGLLEIEAVYESVDASDSIAGNARSGDVDLATVELALDARIAPRVDGHVLIKFEEDEVFVDEGFISLSGPESFSVYLIAGRQYLPFGYFDSHFISDPPTLSLGETNEGALVGGYRLAGGMIDISAGAFNGKSNKAGGDDSLSNYVGQLVLAPLEGIKLAASYTSNLAAADTFFEQVQGDPEDYVAAWSVFSSITLMSKFDISAEYVSATEDFGAGELYAAGDRQTRRPAAWNLELGYAATDACEIAMRYAGSVDGGAGAGEFLPKTQYGAVVNWDMNRNTSLALEYLHSDLEADVRTRDAVLAQLAITF
jgi:hypothetical protein